LHIIDRAFNNIVITYTNGIGHGFVALNVEQVVTERLKQVFNPRVVGT